MLIYIEMYTQMFRKTNVIFLEKAQLGNQWNMIADLMQLYQGVNRYAGDDG